MCEAESESYTARGFELHLNPELVPASRSTTSISCIFNSALAAQARGSTPVSSQI